MAFVLFAVLLFMGIWYFCSFKAISAKKRGDEAERRQFSVIMNGVTIAFGLGIAIFGEDVLIRFFGEMVQSGDESAKDVSGLLRSAWIAPLVGYLLAALGGLQMLMEFSAKRK